MTTETRVEQIRERLDAIRDGSEWGPATAWQIIADARFLLEEYETLLRYARPVDIEAARIRHGEAS